MKVTIAEIAWNGKKFEIRIDANAFQLAKNSGAILKDVPELLAECLRDVEASLK